MTTPRLDHDMALPHAGLLAFLRRPASPRRESDHNSSPPPYDDDAIRCSRRSGDYQDEESTFGFWGEGEHEPKHAGNLQHLDLVKRGYHGFYTFCYFWFVISVCILGAFGAFFVLDLAFTRLGMGTGMATWIVHRNVGRDTPSYEMHFCLATPNRQAPGPQTWRYAARERISECATDTLTLMASSTEAWKAFSDDEVVFGDDLPLKKSGYEVADRFMAVADKVRLEELGDDLAEEGARRY